MVKVTLVTWPPIVACAAPEFTALLTVAIFNVVLAGAKGLAVVNCPAANVILCAPADNTAVAVVHTIASVPAVIVQVADSVAVPPAAGTSTPTGFVLALK